MLLSIVIPTRNRYESLFPVVRALLDNIAGDDYQIVVCDNSSDPAPAERFFNELADARIFYDHTGERLTQSGNTNRALGMAQGEYVLFIGDDDVITPHVLQVVGAMKEQGIDALTYYSGIYYWKGLNVTKCSRYFKPELLLVHRPVDSEFRMRRSADELERVMRMGVPSIMQLPRIYHGIVHRSLLERMRERYGTYAIGSCPDMNLSVVLASMIDRYASVTYPVSLSGVASNSAAGMDARNAHRAELQVMVDQGILPARVIESWNPFLPKVWTIPTIYAQAFYEALNAVGVEDRIDYTQLFARFRWGQSWANKYIRPALDAAVSAGRTTRWAVRREYIKLAARTMAGYLLKPLLGKMLGHPMPLMIRNVASVDACMKELSKIPFHSDATEKR